jgi:hypothetical protein
MQIQRATVKQFNSMGYTAHFVIKPITIKHLKAILAKKENSYDKLNEVEKKSPIDILINKLEVEEDVNSHNFPLSFHQSLRIFKLFYDLGEYEMAYDQAVENFWDMEDAIPNDIWLKIGGGVNVDGKKRKRNRLRKKKRWDMEYRKCKVLLPILRDVIKRIPLKGKHYSEPCLLRLYDILLRSHSTYIKRIELPSLSASEIDKLLLTQCFYWVAKFEKWLAYWHTKDVSFDDDYYLLIQVILAYQYYLKKRDDTGVGSFIDRLSYLY